jgi:hypothetical protein
MAVQSDTSRIQYAGNNSTSTSYAVPFVFLENGHLQAIARTSAGVESVVTLTNHTGAGNVNGGTVRTSVAIPATSTLTIYREVPATQTTTYAEGGDFPAASHERALDKLTQISQQNARKLGSALRLSEANQIGELNPPLTNQQHILSSVGGAAPSWQALPSLSIGPVIATGSTTARSVQDRAADVVNVKDFGAVGNGVADDTIPFNSAITAAQAQGKVLVVPKGTYLLSTEPTISNTLFLQIDGQAVFVGAGAVGFAKFPHAVTNVGNTLVGPYIYSRSNQDPYAIAVNPPTDPVAAGAINAFTAEIEHLNDPAGFPITFTGTLTNGSNIVTSVSSISGLRLYQPVTASIAGLPTGIGAAQTRIAAIGSNTITLDKTFTGSTTSGVTLTAAYWNQKVAIYAGANNFSPSDDVNIWALNTLVESKAGSKGTCFAAEFDVISDSLNAITKGVLISGHGLEQADVALEVDRLSNTWFYGAAFKKCINAISIDTSGLSRGIVFNNSVTFNNSCISGKQLANNTDVIVFQRNTDVSPTGNFLRFINGSNSAEIANIDVAGNFGSVGFVKATTGFFTDGGYLRVTNAANTSILFEATTSSLKIPVSYAAGTAKTYAGTVAVQDINGNTIYLMVAQ